MERQGAFDKYSQYGYYTKIFAHTGSSNLKSSFQEVLVTFQATDAQRSESTSTCSYVGTQSLYSGTALSIALCFLGSGSSKAKILDQMCFCKRDILNQLGTSFSYFSTCKRSSSPSFLEDSQKIFPVLPTIHHLGQDLISLYCPPLE